MKYEGTQLQLNQRSIVLWFAAAQTGPLISPEDGVQAAHKSQMIKYSELAAECREAGSTPVINPLGEGFYTAATSGHS